MQAGQAERPQAGLGLLHGPDDVLGSRGGEGGFHQAHSSLEENAVRLAAGVPADAPALRLRGGGGDTGGAQGGAVGPARMEGFGRQIGGASSGGGLQHVGVRPAARGQVGPQVLVPAVPQNPGSRRSAGGALPDALQARGQGGGLAGYFLQAEGVMPQVEVGIRQAGENDGLLQMLAAGARIVPTETLRVAPIQDFPLGDEEGIGKRLPAVEGMNAGGAQEEHGGRGNGE